MQQACQIDPWNTPLLIEAGQFLYAKLVLENLYAQPTLSSFCLEMQDSCFPQKLSEV